MMSADEQQRNFHLDNAPIVEAVISIKLAEQLPATSLPDLEECSITISNSYPLRDPILAQQVQITIGIGGASNVETPTLLGFFCKEPSSHRVVHLKLDGFGFSELAPYSSWDSFFPAAQKAWAAYQSAVGASTIAGWSVRYINKISWPEQEPMEDYLNVHPNLPENRTQDLLGCFIRLQLSITDPSKGVFAQQVIRVPSLEQGKTSYVLDHEFSYSALGLTETELWRQIDQSRSTKNRYFQQSLTPKALEMYK